MGNDSSQIEKFTDAVLANFDNFINIEGQEVQGIFGKCTLYQKKGKQNEYVICKKIQIGNEAKQKQIQQYFEQRMQIQHPNLLKFYGFSYNKQNNFCSTNYSFNAYYEYHPISLLQENNNRQYNENSFEQIEHKTNEVFQRLKFVKEIYQLNELWYMAKSLISLCEYLQQNEEVHPNIHPSTIFLTEAGQLKLVDSSIMTLITPGQKIHHGSTDNQTQTLHCEQRYIAPEEVVNLKNMNKFKLSIFQVGMTLLESALIQDCSYIYLEDDSINQNSLDFLINKVQEIYGDSFTTFLKKILQLNPNNRPDSFEVFQSQFKSVDFGIQSQCSFNRFSEVGGGNGLGEASPAPRSMRLNSSLINQAVVQNLQAQHGSNTNINNNNSSRVSTSTNNFTSRNNQIQILMNQQQSNIQNQFSDLNRQSNENNIYDNGLIKTPQSVPHRGDKNLFSQQISLQNSPKSRDKLNSSLHNIESKINSSKGMNSSSQINNNNNNNNNGPYLHNFQSFSNTMNNPQAEINTGMNSSTCSIGQGVGQQKQSNNNTNYYSFHQPQSNQYDLQAHSQIKYVESNLKNPYYSQTPPKIRPMQEGSLTVVQQPAQTSNQPTITASQNQSNIYLIHNPNGNKSTISQQQSYLLRENKGNVQVVDYKMNTNPVNSSINSAPLKESNIVQNHQSHLLTSGVQNSSEFKQNSSKYNTENPATNTSTIYKVYYSRSSSPQNQPKPAQTPDLNFPSTLSDTNKFQLQNTSKISSIPSQNYQSSFSDTQKKSGNYYSQLNNNSQTQTQVNANPLTLNNQPTVIQAQRKYVIQQQDQSQNGSLERNKVDGQDHSNLQKKQTTIKSTQIVNPKLIASNLAPK